MTLDEAIAHARAEAELQRKYAKEIRERTRESYLDYGEAEEQCAEEHEQLADWLEELKAIKSDGFTDDLLNMGFTKGYNKAIDDFVEHITLPITTEEQISEIVKQLKKEN